VFCVNAVPFAASCCFFPHLFGGSCSKLFILNYLNSACMLPLPAEVYITGRAQPSGASSVHVVSRIAHLCCGVTIGFSIEAAQAAHLIRAERPPVRIDSSVATSRIAAATEATCIQFFTQERLPISAINYARLAVCANADFAIGTVPSRSRRSRNALPLHQLTHASVWRADLRISAQKGRAEFQRHLVLLQRFTHSDRRLKCFCSFVFSSSVRSPEGKRRTIPGILHAIPWLTTLLRLDYPSMHHTVSDSAIGFRALACGVFRSPDSSDAHISRDCRVSRQFLPAYTPRRNGASGFMLFGKRD